MRRHGTRSCYQGGCREPACVQANRDYQRVRRTGDVGPGYDLRLVVEIEHGTRACYVKRGCRRPECVQANRDYQREYARRRREAGLG